jgi:hypothetical protein
MKKRLLLLICIACALSCKRQGATTEAIVYTNDFQNDNLAGIENGNIVQYNNTAVLGRYNRNTNDGYFKLTVGNLPRHSLVTITFDLYIHDKWDGNKTGTEGPDIWQMLVDDGILINATFNNDDCIPGNFCSPQSYPANYPNSYNNPKTGSSRTDLPGVCALADTTGTTLYKITKTFAHSNSTLVLQCLDKLVQPNVSDQLCDESWSVDNINIKAVTL